MRGKSKSTVKFSGRLNWFLLSGGIVCGIIGSKFWAGEVPHWLLGLPFQALSAWLIWKAFPELKPQTLPSVKRPLTLFTPVKKSRSDLKILSLLALSTVGGALAQFFFSWNLVLDGCVAWALAGGLFWQIQVKTVENPEKIKSSTETILLFILLSVAVLMRFPFVWQHVTGLQIDESNCMEDAFGVINGSLKSPFITSWGGNESLHFWWLALFLKIFGPSVAAARAFSAVLSVGGLFFFYKLCRFFFSVWAAFLASFLMSVGWWYLFYSLSPFQDILVVFWTILTFYFLARALKSGRKIDFWWTGIFLGFCEMEYLPGRLVVAMVVMTLLGIFLVEGVGFLKKNITYLFLTGLSCLWLSGPFIFYIFNNFSTFMSRSKELSLFNEIARTGNIALIPEKFFWTILSFFHRSDAFDPRFCAPGPMIDPFSGWLIAIGMLLAAIHWKKRTSWFALGGLFFGLVTNALAIQGPNPNVQYVNGQRYFVVVPFLFFTASWAMDWFLSFLYPLKSGIKRGGMVLLGLVVAGAVYWNSVIYYSSFRDFQKYGDTYWNSLGFNHIQVADFINANYPRCHILVDWQYNSSTVQVITRPRMDLKVIDDKIKIPIDYQVTKNLLMIFIPNDFPNLEAEIRKVYPRAVWGSLKSPQGSVNVMTVEISQEDIKALQKKLTLEGGLN
jgi:hypothetical protein